VLGALLVACAQARAPGPDARVVVSDGWLAMGTFFEADLRVRRAEVPRARAWLEWARGEIARLEAIFSRHDAESSLSRLNRELDVDSVVREGASLDAELESILESAVAVWSASGGAFDVTVGPLIDVWNEAADRGQWPGPDRLAKATGRVGSEKLLLSRHGTGPRSGQGELKTTMPGVRIDLDGISKGAVLDRLRARFERELSGTAALLSFGESSVVAIGDPGGGGWQLIARSRDPARGELATIRLRDRALSVSSSVGSVRAIGDQRVSHVVDPRTGVAIEGTVESIVIADRAESADAWSTALLVLGANPKAIRLVEQAGLAALVVDSSGRSAVTKDWEEASRGARR
jgi:thiamine biosynthesis lipoprotein